MNQLCLSQQRQPVDQLLRKNANERRGQSSELVLLDQFVKVNAQQLEDKAQMLAVNERVLQP